jgi:hypothetical protein
MSILNSDPQFGRGQTLGVKEVPQGNSTTGVQKVFTDYDPRTSNMGVFLSNRPVTCVAVRNTSGGPLLPGTVVRFKATAILDEVDAPAAAPDDGPMGVVDEYLPATGVADGDVFWVVVSGPVAIRTAGGVVPGDPVAASGGEAVAGAPTPGSYFGYAISEPVNGMVRALVNPVYGHSAG